MDDDIAAFYLFTYDKVFDKRVVYFRVFFFTSGRGGKRGERDGATCKPRVASIPLTSHAG